MDDRTLVLHGLAIKRHADADAVAGLVGVSRDVAERELKAAAASGRVVDVKGAYTLLPLTRVTLQANYDLHFAALRSDIAFKQAYLAFERINPELKAAITDWQTMEVGGERRPNDHSDAAHDDKVIDKIAGIHERIEPALGALANGLPRLAIYAKKLERALDKVERGEKEWVSDVHRESYHTVWFELHEELLRIMGREREE